MDNIRSVPVTRGAFTSVSEEDYIIVMRFSWYQTSHGYAARKDEFGEVVYLHRFINNTPRGFHTDHIDGNKLNNTRPNLRTATNSQNSSHKRKTEKDCSSVFKGVCMVYGRGLDPEKGKKWIAHITKGRERFHLGHFKTELDAALAYNIEATKFFGDFALLNKLPLDYQNKVPEKFCHKKYSKHPGVSFNSHLGYWTTKINGKVLYHKTEEAAVSSKKESYA